MDKQRQEQEHEHTHSINWLVSLLNLLAVSALVLAGCGGAADTSGKVVELAADAVAGSNAQLTTGATCTLSTGCILREEGSNAQWWAD